MSRILVSRNHRMKPAELKKRAENLARQLQSEHGGDYHWDGKTLRYHYGGGIDAEVRLGASDIVVEAKLGFVMRMFRSRLEAEVNDYLDENLA